MDAGVETGAEDAGAVGALVDEAMSGEDAKLDVVAGENCVKLTGPVARLISYLDFAPPAYGARQYRACVVMSPCPAPACLCVGYGRCWRPPR